MTPGSQENRDRDIGRYVTSVQDVVPGFLDHIICCAWYNGSPRTSDTTPGKEREVELGLAYSWSNLTS